MKQVKVQGNITWSLLQSETIWETFACFRGESTKDEPWAWEAREYLRKKLIGEEVWFIAEKPPNATREYGTVFLGKGGVIVFKFLLSRRLKSF